MEVHQIQILHKVDNLFYNLLAVRKELARRNQAAGENMKSQMQETQGELEEVKKNQLDITSGTCIYKCKRVVEMLPKKIS